MTEQKKPAGAIELKEEALDQASGGIMAVDDWEAPGYKAAPPELDPAKKLPGKRTPPTVTL